MTKCSKLAMKLLSMFLFGLLGIYFICVVMFTVSPMRLLDGDGRWFYPPCDISYGIAECECLRKGVDPYDVWRGAVVLDGYRPGLMSPPSKHVFKKTDASVNVHPPWFYTAILPFTFLPHRLAVFIHFAIMVMCFAVLLMVGYKMARRIGCCKEQGVVITSLAVLFISMSAFQDFHSQNWATMMLTAALLMACCLNRGYNVLAGCCWSFLMIKPQVGLIFAVPILMGRKFVAFFVAVFVCLMASVVPSQLCGSSVLRMIMVTPSANYTQFWGCGTLPKVIADLFPQTIAIWLGLALGCVICAVLTRKMMNSGDWFLGLMPAAVCSSLWTYSRCYGHVTAWFFVLVLLLEMAGNPRSKFLWIVFVCSAVLFSRFTNFIHVLAQQFEWLPIPSVVLSDGFHFHVDSIVSFLSLIIVIVFCFRVKMCGKRHL